MKPQYEPKSIQQALGYLVEEAGEVQAAVGKSLRWGLDSVNPELPPSQQERNGFWILRELRDLEGAIKRVRAFLADADFGDPQEEAPGWHPTSELPPDGRVVLVAGDGFMATAFRIDDGWFQTDCDTADGEQSLRSGDEVTHWLELPEAPPEAP